MQCIEDGSSTVSTISQNTVIQLNIVVVGESGVGKSSLCKRFTGESKSVFGPTVIASSWQKTIVVNDVKVKLLICDAGGQEAYRDNITSYFGKKDGVLAVYDVTNKDTFQKLSYWLDLVKKYNSDFIVILVGNKTDYSKEKSVKPSDVSKFGKENGLAFMETSAKDGNNVEKVFEYLVLELFLKKKILSVNELNDISSTLLLSEYESPVLRHISLGSQNRLEDNSETLFAYVNEENSAQVQNIPVIADNKKTPVSAKSVSCPLSSPNNETEQITNYNSTGVTIGYEAVNENTTVSAEPVPYPLSSPNDEIEQITNSNSTEGTNEYEALSENGTVSTESGPCPPSSPIDETEKITNINSTKGTNLYEATSENNTMSAEPVPYPPSSSNDKTEQITNYNSIEEANEYEAVSENGAYFAESPMCNELPPIVDLELSVELYVQRKRRLSTNSISSLANWDSSLAAEYKQVIEQYEEARAEIARKEAARKKKKSHCTLF